MNIQASEPDRHLTPQMATFPLVEHYPIADIHSGRHIWRMVISLLRSSTVLSLEFAPGDRAALQAVIGDLFGEADVKKHIVASTVQIDGEDFTYQSEWDDPCLISSTARGEKILQAIADRFGYQST